MEWVCQRAWDGGAWLAVLLLNKSEVMNLGAVCGFVRNTWSQERGGSLPVVQVQGKEVEH